MVGEILRNRYRILGILAQGGMGTVYAAVDQFRLDHGDGGQQVAIKVLHTEVIARPELVAELRNEFQRLQNLSHPNIVRVHELDRDGDLTFFTMERLSGASLRHVLLNHGPGPLDRAHAMAIIQQVGAAVAYAHSRGVVHGDLKPGNIFVTDSGEIRVLDFGASHRLQREPFISNPHELSRVAVATPSYSSCEVLQGGPANARDDVYAMACISYELLTGRQPYRGKTALEARATGLTPRRPAGISQRQWRTLREGLQLRRELRPDDMQSWIERLQLTEDAARLPSLPAVMNPGAQRRTSGLWMASGMIALLAALFWLAFDDSAAVRQAEAGISATAASLMQRVHNASTRTVTRSATVQPVRTDSAVPAPPPVTHAAVQTPPQSAKAAPPSPARVGAAAVEDHPKVARLEMATDALDVSPVSAVAEVVVRRKDSYRNNVSFTWSTEAGTARSGEDFVPVNSRVEYMSGRDHEARMLIPIVADPRRHVAKSFYVVLDDASDGAKVGARQVTMVTIPASD